MLTNLDAWKIVAERAQSTVQNDDEQLVLCEALSQLAQGLHLVDEADAAASLALSLRSRAEAQQSFFKLLGLEEPAQ